MSSVILLSVDGDADAAVTAMIPSGWLKFSSLTFSSLPKMFPCCDEKFMTHVPSCTLHGSEKWSLKRENGVALHRAEMRMIRWICDVKFRDKPIFELRQTLRIEDTVKGKWFKTRTCEPWKSADSMQRN